MARRSMSAAAKPPGNGAEKTATGRPVSGSRSGASSAGFPAAEALQRAVR